MLTIHGVPISVHTRKIIVTAILKKMDYRIEAVIPVIPDNPPANWSSLSPTGLIPVLQDGDYTLADSNAICLYLEKKQPAPPILPGDARGLFRTARVSRAHEFMSARDARGPEDHEASGLAAPPSPAPEASSPAG